jgi:hypothetical protein
MIMLAPYSLGWVNKDPMLKVTKHCNTKFAISAYLIDVRVPLDVFGIPYMCMRDVMFMRRKHQYRLIKDGKYFIINAHKVNRRSLW